MRPKKYCRHQIEKNRSKYRDISNEHLLNKLKEVAVLLGGAVSINDTEKFHNSDILKDFPKHGIYTKRFGSWSNALKLAGLPNKSTRNSRAKAETNHNINLRMRFRILERDNFSCQYCGRVPRDGAKLVIDHKIAFSKGGKTIPENLITSCFECNAGKSDVILGQKKTASK